MPDWSYQPFLRPLLFRASETRGRAIALGAVGRLERLGLGAFVFDLLGHMRVPEDLALDLAGLRLPGPIGLTAGVDPSAAALPALARFGVGFVEVGPVHSDAVSMSTAPPRRLDDARAIEVAEAGEPITTEAVKARLGPALPLAAPLLVRLAGPATGEGAAVCAEHVRDLRSLAAGFVLAPPQPSPTARSSAPDPPDPLESPARGDASSSAASSPPPGTPEEEHVRRWLQVIRSSADAAAGAPIFAALFPEQVIPALARAALEAGASGLIVDAAVPSDADAGGLAVADADASIDASTMDDIPTEVGETGVSSPRPAPPALRLRGAPARDATRTAVARLRTAIGPTPPILTGGGALEPADALVLLEAGATAIGLHEGLVFSGPGLPKRTHEAIRATSSDLAEGPRLLNEPAPFFGPWLAWLLHALGLGITALIVSAVAATLVILPYDQAFVGLDRAGLHAINPRLLPFMAHDRVSLAGATVTYAILLGGLSLYGFRRRTHWARRAGIWASALGFGSFLLFLGYGYLDPLHLAITVFFLSFFLFGLRAPADRPPEVPAADLHDDRSWRRAMTAQLLWVTLGIGLMGGGLTIALIGATTIFVPSDLVYLQTDAATLAAANPRLLPLVAHDRAAFGGILAADGLLLLLLSLWAFRRGAAWLWWTVLAAGLPGFIAGFGVHLAVGYTDALHLAPVGLAVALQLLGAWLSWPYLVGASEAQAAEAGRRALPLATAS